MKQEEIKKRYNETLKRLHSCSPAERAGLLKILNYWYARLESCKNKR